MADLTDDEFASVVASIGGLPSALTSETGRMIAEVQRHRTAQAADKERIKAVVFDVIKDAFPFTDPDKANFVATRAADQLATATAAVPTRTYEDYKASVHDAAKMVRDLGIPAGQSSATHAVLIGAARAAFAITHVQADGKPRVEDVLDVLLKAVASVPRIALAAHRSEP
jgi:hypothetical protein